jgi:cysteine-rich repeat protein
VAFSAKLLQFSADALAEFKLPPAESKALMFISLQRQLLQSIGSSLTLSQAVKTSENLESMLVPGLLSGSRVDNVAVCASIVNLLALLGRKILYDAQLNANQEQLFSQQLWSIVGGLLQLQTRSASPGFKVSVSSDVSFLGFDVYRVDSTSQRGSTAWIFSSTSERKELGANFSIPKTVVSDTSVLDVIVAVQEFAWRTSDPNYMTSAGSKWVSSSKKFNIVGAVYGLIILDTSNGGRAVETLNSCMNVSVSFDSLKVRQWNPQQRFAKVSIASYNSTLMIYSGENCATAAVGPEHVQSCCHLVSQFAVKITPDATICGDGFADVDYGEECDDGNLIDGDGCDKTCTIENFYKCERSVPNLCTIVPTNVSATCIPPRTCNRHGLYIGGSTCICEPSYFREDCSLKLTPLAAPSLLRHGDTQVLAPGLTFSTTSTNVISSVTIAVFNDSDVRERESFRENGQVGEIMRSTHLQFEFSPSVHLRNSTISIKLNVSGFARWVGSPMLINSNYSFFCLKPNACLWTQIPSSIIADNAMKVTISSSVLPILRRCAIFEFLPVFPPKTPEAVDNSSLLVVYIGTAVFCLALITFFVRRKYKQMQAAKAIIAQASLVADAENDVKVTEAPANVSLSPGASASADIRQIQSSPRELVEVDDLNLDVDLLDSAILASMMGIEQWPSSQMTTSPVSPNRSMSLSPPSGQMRSPRLVSPPAVPRTPDGRRRPKVKVKGTFTLQSQSNSSEFQGSATSTMQERLRAAKSLSPTDRSSLKSFTPSFSPVTRAEPSRRSGSNAPSTDLKSVRTSTGSRGKITGISPPPKISAAVAGFSSAPAGVSRIHRARVLRDADDELSPPRGRMVLSDVSPVVPLLSMPLAAINLETASTLRDHGKSAQTSDTFRASAIDIDNSSVSR